MAIRKNRLPQIGPASFFLPTARLQTEGWISAQPRIEFYQNFQTFDRCPALRFERGSVSRDRRAGPCSPIYCERLRDGPGIRNKKRPVSRSSLRPHQDISPLSMLRHGAGCSGSDPRRAAAAVSSGRPRRNSSSNDNSNNRSCPPARRSLSC